MRVYVCANGQKTLFHEGDIDKQVAKQIVCWCKWYFGWKRIKVLRQGESIVLCDANHLERARKRLFTKEVVA
ncbi:MAG: hypothetical protein QW328_08750 [Nitrososphaerota archaeon]